MTKKEFLQTCWIPHTKRLPPDTQELVVAWNYKKECPWVVESQILRKHAKEWVQNPTCFDSSHNIALFTSHWMKLPGPANDKANQD